MIELEQYRNSPKEKLRVNSLLNLIPENQRNILEIGARDCFISKKLVQYANEIYALDLVKPEVNESKIIPVQGDVTKLAFENNQFDLVLCAEVLEHIPESLLNKACNELQRVTKKYLIIGVPYKQDIRIGQTKCITCGKINPPYGHINRFDENNLTTLFNSMSIEKVDFIGYQKSKTNNFSYFLNKLANFPKGTYNQEETCIYCNNNLIKPKIGLIQYFLWLMAAGLNKIQNFFISKHPIWIHILFQKNNSQL